MTNTTTANGGSRTGSPPDNHLVFRECGAGWGPIIGPLIQRVTELGGSVEQIKEKYGGLRFYFNSFSSVASEGEWDRFEDQLAQATLEAIRTCELCGRPGHMRTKAGWYKTLCDEDALLLGYKESIT